MNDVVYEELLELVTPLIKKQNTVMRDAITVNERLSTTLRFLATGQSFESLKFLTAISPQAIGQIVLETCEAINFVLKSKGIIQMPQSQEQWKIISNDFEKKWNFPHCLGAIDGKHVQIQKPPSSGSYYFNYKKSFSIVLLAIANANYEIIMVEAGANGRVSDGGVFSNSKFFKKYEENSLHLPVPEELPEGNNGIMPYVFVGDNAFPLGENLMKPFGGTVNNEEEIFNYRLSRARRIIENCFGILSSRFRILLNTINLAPEKVAKIVLTCCYLHNLLIKRNKPAYLQGSTDAENFNSGRVQSGSWKSVPVQLLNLKPTYSRNAQANAKEVRKKFCNYFNTVGTVPWQWKMVQQTPPISHEVDTNDTQLNEI